MTASEKLNELLKNNAVYFSVQEILDLGLVQQQPKHIDNSKYIDILYKRVQDRIRESQYNQ